MLDFVKTAYIIELMIAGDLITQKISKKRNYFMRFSLSTLVCLCVAFGVKLPYTSSLLGIVFFGFLFILSVIRLIVINEEEIMDLVFIGIIAYNVKHIASLLFSMVSLVNRDLFYHFGEHWTVNLPILIAYLGTLMAVYIPFYYWIAKKMKPISKASFTPYFIISISGLVLVINLALGMIYEIDLSSDAETIEIFFQYFWNLVASFLLLALQFDITSKNKLKVNNEVLNQIVKQKENQYNLSKNMIENIEIKFHDMKYYLNKSLVDNDNKEEHILKIIEDLDQYKNFVKTGNEILDVILSEKLITTENTGIDIVIIADGKCLNFIDTIDIYVLFGNLLDNAVTAVTALEDGRDKTIYLYIDEKETQIEIRLENCFEGKIEFEDAFPKTTKTDKVNHGYGLKSINQIVDKYKGQITITTNKGRFYTEIVIPFPSQ